MSGIIDIGNYLKEAGKPSINFQESIDATERWMEERGYHTIVVTEDYAQKHKGRLEFSSAVFGGKLVFEGIQSNTVISLRDCAVSGDLVFLESDKSLGVSLQGNDIKGGVEVKTELQNFHLAGGAIQGDLLVEHDLHKLSIESCTTRNIRMRGITISEIAITGDIEANSFDASRMTCSGNAEFSYATFSRMANFSHATFADKTDWSSAEFKGPAVFDRATFTYPPNFRYTLFHTLPDLHGASVTKPYALVDATDTNYNQLAPIHRRLKKLATEANNYRGFLIYAAREMRATCLCNHEAKTILPTLYNAFSDNGRSVLRPLLWLLTVITCSAWFYASGRQGITGLSLFVVGVAALVLTGWMRYRYTSPALSDSDLRKEASLCALISILVAAFFLYFAYNTHPEETVRGLATSVMASFSITQLFRLFYDSVYSAVPCGMMDISATEYQQCLEMERRDFLKLYGKYKLNFIPGVFIVSGVQIFISSILLFLLGLGIRNRIKTG